MLCVVSLCQTSHNPWNWGKSSSVTSPGEAAHRSQRAAGLSQLSPEHLQLLGQDFPGSPKEPLATPCAAVLSFCPGVRSSWKRVCRRLTSRARMSTRRQFAPWVLSVWGRGAPDRGTRCAEPRPAGQRPRGLRLAGFVQLPSVIWIPVCHFRTGSRSCRGWSPCSRRNVKFVLLSARTLLSHTTSATADGFPGTPRFNRRGRSGWSRVLLLGSCFSFVFVPLI